MKKIWVVGVVLLLSACGDQNRHYMGSIANETDRSKAGLCGDIYLIGEKTEKAVEASDRLLNQSFDGKVTRLQSTCPLDAVQAKCTATVEVEGLKFELVAVFFSQTEEQLAQFETECIKEGSGSFARL